MITSFIIRFKQRARYSGKKSFTIRRSGSKGGDVEKTMKLSQGEKLILLMLCEIQEHLKIEGGTNTKLIQEAILSGNLWGLDWGLPRSEERRVGDEWTPPLP